MNVREYMQRRCVCGRPRAEHAHFSNPLAQAGFTVRCATRLACTGFVDEFELELSGNPALNPLLAPLVREQLEALPKETAPKEMS
mgnify:CR=1 FL=1